MENEYGFLNFKSYIYILSSLIQIYFAKLLVYIFIIKILTVHIKILIKMKCMI